MSSVIAPRVQTIVELDEQLKQEILSDRHAAAETMYALAVRSNEAGNTIRARYLANQLVELLSALPSNTIEDVATSRIMIGGVFIPELLHDGVVARRLADILHD